MNAYVLMNKFFFVVYVDIWKFDEWMYVYVWIYGYDIYA